MREYINMDLTQVTTGSPPFEVGTLEPLAGTEFGTMNATIECFDLDNFDYDAHLKKQFLLSNFSRMTLEDYYFIYKFYYIMYGVVLNVICIGGIIGNVLSIIVLSRRNMKSSTSTYLAVLMVCDCVILTGAYFNEVLGIGLHVSIRYSIYIMPFTTVYVANFAQLCRDCGILLTVAVTVERYIYVCHTFKASTMCTMKRAKITCFIIIVCMTIYHIPTFLSQTVIPLYYPECDLTTYEAVDSGRIPIDFLRITKAYIHPILVYMIPIVTLTVLTVILIREVRRSNMFRQQMSSQQQPTDVNVTIVLISVVVMFILCTTPSMVFQILVVWYGTDPILSLEGLMAWHIAVVLVYSNSAVNFILFCSFGQKFRKTFKKTFLRRGPCKQLVINKRFPPSTTHMASLHQKLLENYPQLEMVVFKQPEE